MTTEIADTNKYLDETITLINHIEVSFLVLAERLFKIHAEDLWKANYSTYQEFLVTARISEAKDSKLRLVYSRFIKDYGLKQEEVATVGWSSLYFLASKVDDKEKAIALLGQAEVLSRKDFIDVVLESKVRPHECVAVEKIVLGKCGYCSRVWRVGVIKADGSVVK